jgi:hypothetical protein
LSAKVAIKSDTKVGRYTVAIKAIKASETVLVEEPFAAVLDPSKSGINCANCLTRLKAAIPCKRCSGVAFCSVFCRDEAEESHHKIECEFQVVFFVIVLHCESSSSSLHYVFKDVITGLGCSLVARLSLRIITSRPLSYFLDRKSSILSSAAGSGPQQVSKEKEEDVYFQFLDLVGLESQRWPEDLLARSAMALVLLGILRSSGYFGEKKTSNSPESYTPNELFIASLLFRHLQVYRVPHKVSGLGANKKTFFNNC